MAEDQQKLRLNGLVSELSDKALYDVLLPLPPKTRMGRLRRLAYIGLMYERGGMPVAGQPATPPLAPQKPPSKPARSRDEVPANAQKVTPEQRVVTPITSQAPETSADPVKPNNGLDQSLLDMINVGIMK